jgi:glycosyltransferase involved in cell wall biosynthesis
MACNRPIVSTDVGDVKSLIQDIPGCFIAENNPTDVADKIRQVLHFEHSVGARQRIIDRGLEINETAGKILRVYEQVLQSRKKSAGLS